MYSGFTLYSVLYSDANLFSKVALDVRREKLDALKHKSVGFSSSLQRRQECIVNMTRPFNMAANLRVFKASCVSHLTLLYRLTLSP
ncbi:MAG: hypothetical protein ACI9D5_001671 [Candidatus Endobugula sp.]|jgi:hypothetical protein